ncbi:MAG TPA: ABC transporter substrate-binding protein [Ignavibacteria bacterium]|nr:ABC transporter substrate-binding protein [Ignavibacteria bacterium]HRF67263.1 ABC transporter substrate-binding protein [Ignavibacteria bacterium]
MKAKFILFILLFLSSLLLSSCSKKETTENIFRYNEPQGIENLDPIMCSNYAAGWPLQQMTEGLLEYTQAMNLEDNLASSHKVSEDGLTYTFTIRRNVFFHDNPCFPDGKGREVKAADFKYCFERVCDPSTKTRGAWLFRDKVKGALEYITSIKEKHNNVTEITGIQAPNDTTLIITLTKPFAPFLSILTMPYAFVYPKEAVEYYKDNFGYNPVGTGPFKFVKWEVDRELEMTKNPNYWSLNKAGKPLVYLDGIRVSFLKSSETAFLDFQQGKFDFYDPTPEVLSQVTDETGALKPEYSGEFELVKQPWLNTVYLGIQLDKNVPGGKNNVLSDNRKLRQAINYAIDREKIITYVLKFRGTPGVNGPIPPGMPGYNKELKGYSYDVPKAKQLLSEAGYPDGKGLSVKLVVSNDDTQKLIGESVQAQLKDLGIDAQLDFMQSSTMRSSQVGGELAFWRGNWGADYFDPENFMALFYSKNHSPIGPNYTHYQNAAADSLYELAMKLTDFEVRKKLYNQMEQVVLEDSPWIILYYNQIVYLKNKKVSNMYVDGLNTIILKQARIGN